VAGLWVILEAFLSSAALRLSEGVLVVLLTKCGKFPKIDELVLLTRCGKFPKIDELLVARPWVVLEAFLSSAELRLSESTWLVSLTRCTKLSEIDKLLVAGLWVVLEALVQCRIAIFRRRGAGGLADKVRQISQD
jgi:hypothetical protein